MASINIKRSNLIEALQILGLLYLMIMCLAPELVFRGAFKRELIINKLILKGQKILK